MTTGMFTPSSAARMRMRRHRISPSGVRGRMMWRTICFGSFGVGVLLIVSGVIIEKVSIQAAHFMI